MRVGPRANDSCPYKKGERDTAIVRRCVKTEAETRGTHLQTQEGKDCRQEQQLRERRGVHSSWSLSRELGPADTSI